MYVCVCTGEGVAEGNIKNLENELKPVLPTSKLILTLWVVWDQAGFSHPPASTQATLPAQACLDHRQAPTGFLRLPSHSRFKALK